MFKYVHEATQTATPPPPEDPSVLARFSQLIATLNGGALDTDASRILETVVSDLREAMSGLRAASATITVAVTLHTDRGMVRVTGDVKAKLPRQQRSPSLLHVADGFLVTRDTRQAEMPLPQAST